MAKFKEDYEKQKRIKTIVVSELKKNPNCLGGKEIKICKEKSEGYDSETVNVFIKQTDKKSFKIMLWNLSSEFNVLFYIQNALIYAFAIRNINVREADSTTEHYAATVQFDLWS